MQSLLQPLFSYPFSCLPDFKQPCFPQMSGVCLECACLNQNRRLLSWSWVTPYSVFHVLSRQFFKQLPPRPMLLYLGVQFVHVVGHRQ